MQGLSGLVRIINFHNYNSILSAFLKKGVHVFDIDSMRLQYLNDSVEPPRLVIYFHGNNLGLLSCKITGLQDTKTSVVVRHNNPEDSEINGIAEGKGTDVDPLFRQKFCYLCDSPLFVLQENGYLFRVNFDSP